MIGVYSGLTDPIFAFMRLGGWLLLVAVAGHTSVPLCTAAGFFSTTTTPQQSSTFRVDSELVLLSLAVRDRDNLPVQNLSRDHFQIFEDDREQEITYFEERRSPPAIVLCIDISSSMREGLLAETKRAALDLLGRLHDQSRIAVVAFNEKVSLIQPFTGNLQHLQRAVQELEASGGTALLDALSECIRLVLEHEYPRQIVVVLTDGKDQDSRARFQAIERRVAGSGVLVYPVGVYHTAEKKRYSAAGMYFQEPKFEQNLNPIWILQHLAELSGGLSFFPEKSEPLTPVFASIGEDLSHFYEVGYLPPESGEPHLRRIEARLAGLEGSPTEITVRTRQAYFR